MGKGAVLTGQHFMMGNIACAEGALAAGCEFAAGYPITPATEIANRLAERLPQVGGVFLQMEDEISSIAADHRGFLDGQEGHDRDLRSRGSA